MAKPATAPATKTWEVTVKPNARQQKVEVIDETSINISVTASPQAGKANQALIRLLAKHFSVPQSAITILRGHKNRKKYVQVAQ